MKEEIRRAVSGRERIYRLWEGMKRRCRPSASALNKQHYYDKGITVCKRWQKFSNFYEDMGPAYADHKAIYGQRNTTIDRIDPTKGYKPSNCRWVDWKSQNLNKRATRKVTINGVTKPLFTWAEELGEDPRNVLQRFHLLKMSYMKALAFPFHTDADMLDAYKRGFEKGKELVIKRRKPVTKAKPQ